jgi:phospholipid/cholesterol/gamma-HCH transport system permease protein
MSSFAGFIGRNTIEFVKYITGLCALFFRIIALIVDRPVEGRLIVWKTIIEQIYFTAVQALAIIVPLALLMGGMLIIQLSKLSGDFEMGKVTVVIVIRELGPIITALLVTLRSATAVTIEIAYMNVFNEIEAIEMTGADPFRLICVPRFVGITTAVVGMVIVFDTVAIMGGNIAVWFFFETTINSFLSQIGRAISHIDIIVGLLKAVIFGISITVISLYHGFMGGRKVTFIPVSASKCAVQCFFCCIVENIIISAVFYL